MGKTLWAGLCGASFTSTSTKAFRQRDGRNEQKMGFTFLSSFE